VPAFPVRPVDTTGAGDSFDAGFLVRWLDGAPPREAAEFANGVAALTSSGLGAVEPIPTRARVERFLAAEGRQVSQVGPPADEG
jgi:2-dehydro-3-deoxygluconokinase